MGLSKERQISATMISCFETWLDKVLTADEKERIKKEWKRFTDDEPTAIIYGVSYYDLEDELVEIIKKFVKEIEGN
ncbi:hypothetical protein HQ529_03520 [Candidatus Woesearchaeota archaeon]|nr:hypothetical protein [Candidatus Woesearchaeota archaeon]